MSRTSRARTLPSLLRRIGQGGFEPWWNDAIGAGVAARLAAAGRHPGAGILKGIGAAVESIEKHERAKEEAEAREQAARQTLDDQAKLVQLIDTKPDDYGRPLIWMRFHNGAQRDVAALGVNLVYLNQQRALAQDPNCGGPTNIPAGQTVWLTCDYYQVRGADRYQVEITGVQFR